jgi:hypothetical protein
MRHTSYVIRNSTILLLACVPLFGQQYTMSTIAGDGVAGAFLTNPMSVAVDSEGNVVFGDWSGFIRKIRNRERIAATEERPSMQVSPGRQGSLWIVQAIFTFPVPGPAFENSVPITGSSRPSRVNLPPPSAAMVGRRLTLFSETPFPQQSTRPGMSSLPITRTRVSA